MRALWNDVRTLETKMAERSADDESIFRAILTWSGTVTTPQAEPAAEPKKSAAVAKARPERTRVLRDPAPCIVRDPPAEEAVAP